MVGLALFFIGCGDDSGKKTAATAPEASKEVVYKVGSSADYPPLNILMIKIKSLVLRSIF